MPAEDATAAAAAAADDAEALAASASSSAPAAEEKEEKPECGFCTYMRAGPCGDLFEKWEACVDEHRDGDEFVTACSATTVTMAECLQEHPEYYDVGQPEKKEEAAAEAGSGYKNEAAANAALER